MANIAKRWKEDLSNFTSNTTAHGIPRIARTDQPCWYRLIWAVFITAAMALSIFNCEERLREYFSHPFQIVETFEPQSRIQFPAVTFCSAFPLPVIGKGYDLTRARLDELKEAQCYNRSKSEALSDQLGSSEEVMLFSVAGGNLTDLGFTADSLIPRCRFSNQHCSASNFTRYIDPDFFNCYTFNTDKIATANSNLDVLLYIRNSGQTYNYTDVLEFFASGAFVQVHESNIHPSPLVLGRAMTAGTFNHLSLKTTKSKLLKHPVSTNCTNDSIPEVNYRYNVDVCYKTCQQKLITEKCGCSYAGVHIEKPAEYGGPYCLSDYCNQTLVRQQAKCLVEFYDTIDLNSECLQCKMPRCVRWDFQVSHSMIDYFLHISAQDFAEDMLPPDHPAIEDMIDMYENLSNVPDNFISSNFISVRVTFADLHTLHRTAVTQMTAYSLFSDLGGAFSFWIGFSIMTFVEIIEWLVRMLLSIRPRSKTKHSSPSAGLKPESQTQIAVREFT